MNVPNSQPLIICVENKSKQIIKNIEIIHNFKNLNFINEKGNLVIDNIVISSGIPNISYQEMLFVFQYNEPIEIVSTFFKSLNIKQKTTIELNELKYNLDLLKDKDIEFIEKLYIINKDTKLEILDILPKTTLTIYFYPKPFNLTE